MACLGVCRIKGGRREIIALSLSDKGRKRHVCAAAQSEPENKPSKRGGLQVEARQKIPEPRHNGSATEANGWSESGKWGSPGPRAVLQRGLWNWTDSGSRLSSSMCWPSDLGQVDPPLSASASSSVKWGFAWGLSGGRSSGPD